MDIRLILPEWGNGSLDYMQWCEVETCARLAVVFLGWCVTLKLIERRYLRTHSEIPPDIAPSGHTITLV
jgi:hypothetical protein